MKEYLQETKKSWVETNLLNKGSKQILKRTFVAGGNIIFHYYWDFVGSFLLQKEEKEG